jgi:hypothetical protein
MDEMMVACVIAECRFIIEKVDSIITVFYLPR